MPNQLNTYQQLADRTAKHQDFNFDLTHAGLALPEEAGEFAGAVKKYLIYGKDIDKDNMLEELGDILWYVALAATTLEVTLEEIATLNIEKLQKRYPEKYTDGLASQRLDKVEEFVRPLTRNAEGVVGFSLEVPTYKPQPWKSK